MLAVLSIQAICEKWQRSSKSSAEFKKNHSWNIPPASQPNILCIARSAIFSTTRESHIKISVVYKYTHTRIVTD